MFENRVETKETPTNSTAEKQYLLMQIRVSFSMDFSLVAIIEYALNYGAPKARKLTTIFYVLAQKPKPSKWIREELAEEERTATDA